MEEVEDDRKSGRSFTSRTDENIERVRQKVRSDRRLAVRMIADELGMNSERVWRIIAEDLGMRKIWGCGRSVQKWYQGPSVGMFKKFDCKVILLWIAWL